MATSIQEKITKARDAGYNDDEIVKFLGETPDFGPKLKTAIDAGYKSDEILGYLSQPTKTVSEGIPTQRRVDFASMTPEERKQAKFATVQATNPLIEVAAGGVRGAGSIGATILRPFETAEENVQRRQAMDEALQQLTGASPESFGYKSGKVGAEIAGTMGGPSLVAKGLRYGATIVPSASRFLTPAATAIESGGFGGRVAQNRFADIAARSAAGGVSGAVSTAPIGEVDVGAGTALGAIFPLGPLAVQGTRNIYRNFFPSAEQRAANIVRQAAGEQLPIVRTMAGAAPETETAAQAISAADAPQLQALGEVLAARDSTRTIRNKLARQEEVNQNTLARMAGGPTQTAAMQEAERMKAALNAQTAPIRQEALGQANRTTATIQRAEEISRRGREFGVPPGGGNAYLYPAGSTEREVALATARSAEDRLASIRAAGLEPLNVNGMVSNIERRLANPEVGIPDINSKALNNVSAKLREWADENGTITAEALYAVRKSAINDVIEQLMPNASQSAKNARAASVLSEVKPMIDDAIQRAGGRAWRDYLHSYEMGMRGIDQTKMAAQLMDLYQTNKPGFVRLMQGNDPAAVESIFGPGSYDIVREMGSKIQTIRPIAAGVERSASMAEQAQAGKSYLDEIIQQNTRAMRIPSFIPKSTAANAVLAEMQSRLGTKVLNELEKGFASGASLKELLDKVPKEHKSYVSRILATSGGLRSLPVTTQSNNLAPENRNALSQ